MSDTTSSTTGLIAICREITQLGLILGEEGFPSIERSKLRLFFTKNSNNVELLDLVSNVLNTIPVDNYNERLTFLKGLLPEQSSAAVLLTESIDYAKSDAEKLFNDYAQVLLSVAKNDYKPYPHFKASENNRYKKFIDENNIPIVCNEPNLLLHNLPEQNEEGLTDYDSFKKHIENTLSSSNKTIIMGTSGCGKTRLCFEALCHNYGLYLVAVPYSVGSIDLEISACWTRDNIENKQPKEAESIAERAVMSCIVGRLLLLQYLFNVAKQHNVTMAPKSWLTLQLDHVIIRELSLIFLKVTDLTSIKALCDSIMNDIKKNFTKIFPIIYDEAQAHTTYLSETFPSTRFVNLRERPFFFVVVQTLSSLCYSFTGTIVCITGSSLSLLQVRDEISSRGKEESYIPTFYQFGQIETSDELFKLVTRILPLEKEYTLSAIKWLKGRYRWSWTWIHYLIKSEDFNPEKQLDSLIFNLTTSGAKPNKHYSIYTSFEDLAEYPSKQLSYINDVPTLELIKKVIISHSMTGRPIMFVNTYDKDIIDLGFAHIKNIQNLTSVINEPLVIQAGLNYFVQRNSNDMWFQLMLQTKFNASMAGLIWEKIVVNFLRKKLFESNKALSESGMFFEKKKLRKRKTTINYNYLPEDFERPPKLLPYGNNCMGRIAVESTTADNYFEWLRAVAEWEKTGNVSKEFCPICYPPNTAGPDISIAFFFPRAKNDMQLDEKRKSYILNVQVRLKKKAVIKDSFRTVEPDQMFINKNGKCDPPKANATLNEIYQDQDWFDRNMQMIIIYPCNPQRKGEYQKQIPGSSRRGAIPRVIIDMENASTLFPEDCQKWIQEFKRELPGGLDCSDVEDKSE